MFLTISTTHRPAGDLGYLLHEHPGRVQSFTESVGTAHVFYPENTGDRSWRRSMSAMVDHEDPDSLTDPMTSEGDGLSSQQR